MGRYVHGVKMNQVVLLGTKHTFQRGNSQFYAFIEKLVDEYKIACIAEEIDKPKPSSASKLSKTKTRTITHIVIEPTPDELRKLNMPNLEKEASDLMFKHNFSWPANATEEQLPLGVWGKFEEIRERTHRLRENEWWRRIQLKNTWPCLVICGSSHYHPFKEKLIKQGVQVIDTEECWEN
jgi:hypothetical protein